MFRLFRADLTFQYVTKTQTQMHLVHSAADRSYVQPLNKGTVQPTVGFLSLVLLSSQSFPNSQNQSTMGVTKLLASLFCQSA